MDVSAAQPTRRRTPKVSRHGYAVCPYCGKTFVKCRENVVTCGDRKCQLARAAERTRENNRIGTMRYQEAKRNGGYEFDTSLIKTCPKCGGEYIGKHPICYQCRSVVHIERAEFTHKAIFIA